jgi:hypothetical protein
MYDMAVTNITTCDLHTTGEAPKAQTHTFSLDNRSYMIDLCPEHLAQFNTTLQEYVSSSRRSAGRSAPRSRQRASSATPSNRVSEVREWARRNGMEVSSKGRIPLSVMQAYDSADAGQPKGRNSRYSVSDNGDTTKNAVVVEVNEISPSQKRRPGRPKGSKNVKTAAASRRGRSQVTVAVNGKPVAS